MEQKKGLSISEKIKIYSEVDRDLGIDFDLTAIRKRHSAAKGVASCPDCLVCGVCLSHFDDVDKFTDHKKEPCEPYHYCKFYGGKRLFQRLRCNLCQATLITPWALLMHVYTAHQKDICVELPEYLAYTPPSSPEPVRFVRNREQPLNMAKPTPRAVSFSNRDDVVLISPVQSPYNGSDSELIPPPGFVNTQSSQSRMNSTGNERFISQSAVYNVMLHNNSTQQSASKTLSYVQRPTNIRLVHHIEQPVKRRDGSNLDRSPEIKLCYEPMDLDSDS